MTDPAAPDLTPDQAALFARLRRMMLIAGLTTAIAIGAVLVAIGYRLFRGEGSTPATIEQVAMLPKGARIVSTAAAGDRLVVTIAAGDATEILTFDVQSLKPLGRLTFTAEP